MLITSFIGMLALPALLAGTALFAGNHRRFGWVNFAGYLIGAAGAFSVARAILTHGPVAFGTLFYLDGLSAFFLVTIAVLTACAALYSIAYLEGEVADGTVLRRKAGRYYLFFNLFAFSMYLVVALNNLGLLWVAIEMTTLASAFLVGFHNDKLSVEAAWKYLIICSVGISLALFGTILFSYAVSAGGAPATMDWTAMMAAGRAGELGGQFVRIAFLFILVGYGTKAGLVPLHTWLPDAHSQALSPISALLSGVLLKTALYAILRFALIANEMIGTDYVQHLIGFFGILSLGVAAGFILVQRDVKRLLAYSSIEHIGIICIGLGTGTTLGTYGALLHIFNHAITKAAMFFGAGSIARRYGTTTMQLIRGAGRVLPFAGTVLIIGAFALAGTPPFSVFISECMILMAAFASRSYLVAALYLVFVAIAFGGIIYHISRIVFGRAPEGVAVGAEALSGRAALLFLVFCMLTLGLVIPGFFDRLLTAAVGVICGGGTYGA